MTKALNQKANNALVADDFMEVYVKHVVGMATYDGFAAPLSDAMKWFNYKNQDMVDGYLDVYKRQAADRITPTLINKAATHLKKMKAPKIDGSYVAIIHPSVSEDLREDESWIDVHKYSATEEIFNGEIGKLHGVRFVESTEQKVYCGTDVAANSRTVTVQGARRV